MTLKEYYKQKLSESLLNEVTSYTHAQRKDKNIEKMEQRHLEMLKKLAARFKKNPYSVKSNIDDSWTAKRLMNMMRAKGYSVRLADFDPKSSDPRFDPTKDPFDIHELSPRLRDEAARDSNIIRTIIANPARAKIARDKRKFKIIAKKYGLSNN